MGSPDGCGPRLIQALDLPGGDVHVWRASVDVGDAELDACRNQLSRGEMDRAAQFRFPRDRARFIARRGVLRALLGRYVGIAPQRLRFCFGDHGKPALAGSCGPRLNFNLSHSDGVALYAISRTRDVGIDVERVRDEFPWQELAGQVLSARERAAISALPPAMRRAAFYTWWTRKEAFLKATGRGLADPLDELDLWSGQHTPLTFDQSRGDAVDISRWSLYDVTPGAGYVATLAVSEPMMIGATQSPTTGVHLAARTAEGGDRRG